jgi:hypothetical protein
MKKLIKLSLEDSSILIEAEEPETKGEMIRISSQSPYREIVDVSNKTFEESIGVVKPVAETILTKLKDISEQPDEVGVSFGISIDLKAGMFITAGSQANFNVTLTWKK